MGGVGCEWFHFHFHNYEWFHFHFHNYDNQNYLTQAIEWVVLAVSGSRLVSIDTTNGSTEGAVLINIVIIYYDYHYFCSCVFYAFVYLCICVFMYLCIFVFMYLYPSSSSHLTSEVEVIRGGLLV